jgi:hypothetical protein
MVPGFHLEMLTPKRNQGERIEREAGGSEADPQKEAAWTIGGAWTIWQIQAPAERKVVPALLYLGLVAVRVSRGGP